MALIYGSNGSDSLTGNGSIGTLKTAAIDSSIFSGFDFPDNIAFRLIVDGVPSAADIDISHSSYYYDYYSGYDLAYAIQSEINADPNHSGVSVEYYNQSLIIRSGSTGNSSSVEFVPVEGSSAGDYLGFTNSVSTNGVDVSGQFVTAAPTSFDLTHSAAHDFKLTIDGAQSANNISLSATNYGDGSTMAAALETAINADANHSGITVDYNGEGFVIRSGTSGSESSVSFVSLGTSADSDLGFANGKSYEVNDINDLISGEEGDDYILGLEGDDTLHGGQGRDLLYGGQGNDRLYGDSEDSLIGGEGSDTLYISNGNNDGGYSNGGQGDDFLVGNDGRNSLFGDDGNDILNGNGGRDTLVGGNGNDTILFGIGDGTDYTYNDHGVFLPARFNMEDIVDTIRFKSGLSAEDIEVFKNPDSPSAHNLELRIIGTEDVLYVSQFFSRNFDSTITSIEFEDGGYLDMAALYAIDDNTPINASSLFSETPVATSTFHGTIGADSIKGTSVDDLIYSYGVNTGVESIEGNGGSDTIVFNRSVSHSYNNANDADAHVRIRDFTIDDTHTNTEADVLDIGHFLYGSDLDASNIGNYLHVVSGAYGENRSGIFVDRQGHFTNADRAALSNNIADGGYGADLFLEFQGQASNNNLAQLTGFSDNSVGQFQTLIDWGFLDLSSANSQAIAPPEEDSSYTIQGTAQADNLIGTPGDDDIFSAGLNDGIESIRGNGGSDTLILDSDDAIALDSADDTHGHFRIRDFIIGNVNTNNEADTVDISTFLETPENNPMQLLDYLHIVSGVYGQDKTGIFIDKDGNFTDAERAALDADPAAGGNGADVFLEFQGQAGNNNLADITGYEDNSEEQVRTLLDWGFLKVTESAVAGRFDMIGTSRSDVFSGSPADENIFSGGIDINNNRGSRIHSPADSIARSPFEPVTSAAEIIWSHGGSDQLIIQANDSFTNNDAGDGRGHIRVRDFIIDDINTNDQADVLNISDLLSGNGIELANVGDHLHIVSGVYGINNRSGIFIDKDDGFDSQEREALDANVIAGGHGADLYIEFQAVNGYDNNNLEQITGHSDNSAEQIQLLIDMGFLDIV